MMHSRTPAVIGRRGARRLPLLAVVALLLTAVGCWDDPPPGITVNQDAIPRPADGATTPLIGRAGYGKTKGDGTAAFRVNCRFFRMDFVDPIVAPRRPRASHLHIFFGNTTTGAWSTPETIRTTGGSTCTGGTANRSAYWAPAIIDTSTGDPVLSSSSWVDREHFLQVYYKSGYDGVQEHEIVNFPPGLRMIAGSAMSTGPQRDIVTYSCVDGNREIHGATSFPDCSPGQLFVMSVKFPQCWDGRNLDSPDHKSHMAYGLGWYHRGCPDTHPVPLPQITQNYRYRVPSGGMDHWRLSSDVYDGPAGYSGHADWMNGWDPAVFQRMLDNCYRGGYDCQMNLLGDGTALQ